MQHLLVKTAVDAISKYDSKIWGKITHNINSLIINFKVRYKKHQKKSFILKVRVQRKSKCFIYPSISPANCNTLNQEYNSAGEIFFTLISLSGNSDNSRSVLDQVLFSQQYSTHFNIQVWTDQPPGDTIPVGFPHAMQDISSVTGKHPLAFGVIITSFPSFLPHKAGIPVPACSCQQLLFPHLPGQSGQNKFWVSWTWIRLFP